MASKMIKLGAVGLGFAGWTCVLAGQAMMQVRAQLLRE